MQVSLILSSFVRKEVIQSQFYSKPSLGLLLMHCLPGISTKCSAVPQEVSTQVGWTSNVSQCYVSTSSCSAYSSLIIGFSPASYISTLCMHSLVFSQKLRCMEQFVGLAPSSLFLFPPNSNQLSLPKLNSLVSSLQNCCALPRYSLVC